ncbi:MAG: MBL fold metallo-hydrolase [Firmicutes bacterium]|nr:MBL fold metallo-hydrolase [Bacillota bacterium]
MPNNLPIIPIVLPLPFPSPESVNAYLIEDDPLTLVDPGLKSSCSLEILSRALANRGIALQTIKRILLTHGHVDHFGAAAELQRQSGAEILIHKEDLSKIATPDELVNEIYLYNAGIPSDVINSLGKAYQMMNHYCDPIEDVTVFNGNRVLEFEHFSLQSLHLPGHSSGHAVFYWPEKRLLLSGDLVLPHITTNPLVEYTTTPAGMKRSLSLGHMLASLQQLAAMEIDLILPGHGPQIKTPHDLISSRIAFYQQRLEEIYVLLKSTGPQNPYQLALVYFGERMKGFDIILAVNEILVNLDLLVHQGRAFEKQVNGVSVFGVG